MIQVKICSCGVLLGRLNRTGLCPRCKPKAHCKVCRQPKPLTHVYCDACREVFRRLRSCRPCRRPHPEIREELIEEHRRRVEREERQCRGK